MFLPSGSLDDNARLFMDESNTLVKGLFPYERLTEENYREELKKETFFENVYFYNTLTKQHITDNDYVIP
jgi:hypothetical protein